MKGKVDFFKRGVELLAAKFILDYDKKCKELGSLEMESVFESWSKFVIRDRDLRDKVWSVVYRKYLRK